MDMETVDSTVNAQHRVNGCGQGRNEVEVVGDVGEAFSLSLSLSLSLRLGSPTICRAKAHTDNPLSIQTEYGLPWTRLPVLHVLRFNRIQILSGPALRHIRQVKMVAKIQTGQQKSKIR